MQGIEWVLGREHAPKRFWVAVCGAKFSAKYLWYSHVCGLRERRGGGEGGRGEGREGGRERGVKRGKGGREG